MKELIPPSMAGGIVWASVADMLMTPTCSQLGAFQAAIITFLVLAWKMEPPQ